MAQKTASRGRPKGSGLDDAGPLAAIANMIAANPGMKPTTAIKALGYTDPSTVRRLRDKYHQRRAANTVTPAIPAIRSQVDHQKANNVIDWRTRAEIPRRDAPASRPATRVGSAAKAEASATAADEHPARQSSVCKPDLFAAAYAASVATAKTAIHLHYKSVWYAFHWSPYAFMIRNTEFMHLVLTSLKEEDDRSR